MPVQITIREVPDRVRDELASRAALAGMSMQEYLRGELERLASRPSVARWLEAVGERKRASKRQLRPAEILKQRDTDRR